MPGSKKKRNRKKRNKKRNRKILKKRRTSPCSARSATLTQLSSKIATAPHLGIPNTTGAAMPAAISGRMRASNRKCPPARRPRRKGMMTAILISRTLTDVLELPPLKISFVEHL
jgi:hypothetical protein